MSAGRAFSMENALGRGQAAGDPLASLRNIRVPPEGIRALGLPDGPMDSPPLGPGNDKSAKGKGGQSKGGLGGGEGKFGSGEAGDGAAKLGWFDVTVVDAWGSPVAGIVLEISYQGTRKKVRTPPNGKVRVEDVDSSFGSVRFVDVPAARALLRPRWVKKPPETPPDVVNPTAIALADEMGAVSLTSETPMTVVVVKALTRVRLVGMHFDTNKSFMRPTAVHGIRLVVAEFEKSPKGNVLIVGHTDSVGSEDENLGLSVDRAESVQAYLRNDVKAWEVWFSKGKPKKNRWGDLEITQMISGLPCEQSISGFQQFSNETRGTSLVVDGKAGEVTKRELIRAYMELGGTTLPESVGLSVHGCGEFFPEEDVGDGVEDEENRRVEMFCYDDAINPPVPGKRAKKGEKEYPQWRDQVTKNVDVSADPFVTARIRLADELRNPIPFAICRDEATPAVVRFADEEGFIEFEIPVKRGLELEWDRPERPRQFSFHRRITLIGPTDPDEAAATVRLRHLGFQGETLADLVRDYQTGFRREPTGLLSDIREELFSWHDGGNRPTPSSPG